MVDEESFEDESLDEESLDELSEERELELEKLKDWEKEFPFISQDISPLSVPPWV